jgi:hypothetical protein
VASHEFVTLRRAEQNPRDGRCQLHLQRICGTCAHFQGTLRGAGDVATCAFFQLAKHRRASAASCTRWSRRAADA